MIYENTKIGTFLSRPNRFLAHVMLDGREVVCHVKNTGRLRELLLPGAPVAVQFHPDAAKMGRKTEYSLIAVQKPISCHGNKEDLNAMAAAKNVPGSKSDMVCLSAESVMPCQSSGSNTAHLPSGILGEAEDTFTWVNIDSQAPNQVAYEWLSELAKEQRTAPFLLPKDLRREVRFGQSRFDLAFVNVADGGKPWLMEVKGVTLDADGTAMFPDAPTERGVKHLEELANAVENGFGAAVLFVIQMKGISAFAPHAERHPEFAEALVSAAERGVHVLAYDCIVTENSLQIDVPVPVIL